MSMVVCIWVTCCSSSQGLETVHLASPYLVQEVSGAYWKAVERFLLWEHMASCAPPPWERLQSLRVGLILQEDGKTQGLRKKGANTHRTCFGS